MRCINLHVGHELAAGLDGALFQLGPDVGFADIAFGGGEVAQQLANHVFIAGFFIDFIEIVFIIVPVVTPIFIGYGTDLIWLGILLGINLQTSFLSPPFGFALFYLKGVAPPEVKTIHLYTGIIPFLIIQVLLLILVVAFPELLGIVGSK